MAARRREQYKQMGTHKGLTLHLAIWLQILKLSLHVVDILLINTFTPELKKSILLTF